MTTLSNSPEKHEVTNYYIHYTLIRIRRNTIHDIYTYILIVLDECFSWGGLSARWLIRTRISKTCSTINMFVFPARPTRFIILFLPFVNRKYKCVCASNTYNFTASKSWCLSKTHTHTNACTNGSCVSRNSSCDGGVRDSNVRSIIAAAAASLLWKNTSLSN